MLDNIFNQNESIYSLVSENYNTVINKFEEINEEINSLHRKINSLQVNDLNFFGQSPEKLAKKESELLQANTLTTQEMQNKIDQNLKLIELKGGENGEIEQKQKKIIENEEFLNRVINEKNSLVDYLDENVLSNLCK